MRNETIAAVLNGLDLVAILLFLGVGIFAVAKPEKAWKYSQPKKLAGKIKVNQKSYKRMRFYGILIIIAASIGIIEFFI